MMKPGPRMARLLHRRCSASLDVSMNCHHEAEGNEDRERYLRFGDRRLALFWKDVQMALMIFRIDKALWIAQRDAGGVGDWLKVTDDASCREGGRKKVGPVGAVSDTKFGPANHWRAILSNLGLLGVKGTAGRRLPTSAYNGPSPLSAFGAATSLPCLARQPASSPTDPR